MRDDDGGLALHEKVERCLHDRLVGRVEGGGGLVEEEHLVRVGVGVGVGVRVGVGGLGLGLGLGLGWGWG